MRKNNYTDLPKPLQERKRPPNDQTAAPGRKTMIQPQVRVKGPDWCSLRLAFNPPATSSLRLDGLKSLNFKKWKKKNCAKSSARHDLRVRYADMPLCSSAIFFFIIIITPCFASCRPLESVLPTAGQQGARVRHGEKLQELQEFLSASFGRRGCADADRPLCVSGK